MVFEAGLLFWASPLPGAFFGLLKQQRQGRMTADPLSLERFGKLHKSTLWCTNLRTCTVDSRRFLPFWYWVEAEAEKNSPAFSMTALSGLDQPVTSTCNMEPPHLIHWACFLWNFWGVCSCSENVSWKTFFFTDVATWTNQDLSHLTYLL